jgi:hypothetical protein
MALGKRAEDEDKDEDADDTMPVARATSMRAPLKPSLKLRLTLRFRDGTMFMALHTVSWERAAGMKDPLKAKFRQGTDSFLRPQQSGGPEILQNSD